MENFKLKYTAMSKIKSSMDEISENNRGEEIGELEDKAIEITQSEQQRGSRQKKMNRDSGTCDTTVKDVTFISSEFKKKRRKRVQLKKQLKK